MLLRQLAPNRLVARCKHAPALAPARPILVRRPVEPCSWSKRDEVLSNWDALKDNPSEWYDNRARKQNDRQPDFVRKDDRSVAIWVDSRDIPEWADEFLSELDERQQNRGANREVREDHPALLATAERWQSLRDNPDSWYDNRNRKTNDRQPDFVYKDDRSTALWLNSRFNPDWAGEVIAELESRPRTYQGGRGEGGESRVIANWELLRDDPDGWYDNRKRKTSDRQPDFVRRDNRQIAIWLDHEETPSWADEVLDAVALRRAERAIERGVADERWAASFAKWKDLWDNPDGWTDIRHTKASDKQPDFVFKADRQVALWLQGGWVPEWVEGVLVKLKNYDMQQDATVLDAEEGGESSIPDNQEEAENWELLRTDPNNWFDNRDRKSRAEDPDFRRKDIRGMVLWLDSPRKPEWVDAFIPILDARRVQREARRFQLQQEQLNNGGNGYDNEQPRQTPQYYEDGQQYQQEAEQQPRYSPRGYEGEQQQQQYMGQEEVPRRTSSRGGAAGGAGDWEMKRAMEAANWDSLRLEPDQWYDNRQMKANERWPDFRRKDNKNVALWLNSRNVPEWLSDYLPVLDERQAQRAAARSAADYSLV